jgi:hypothetical protein
VAVVEEQELRYTMAVPMVVVAVVVMVEWSQILFW